MIASQNLFRRHRTRDGEDESENPDAPSSGGDGGGGSSSPTESDVASTERRDDVGSNNNQQSSNAGDDEEQELIIHIPSGHPDADIPPVPPSPFELSSVPWEPSEETVALRREAVHREVERVQRANFIHFLILCLVPTTLLIIVISAIVSEDGECSVQNDGLTVCEREPRSFVNAFTSRCICDAVKRMSAEDENDDVA